MTQPAGGGYGDAGGGDRAAPPPEGPGDRYEVGGHGVARIAAWPLETLDGLRSPALVDAVGAWLDQRAAVAAEGRALAEVVGATVPALGPDDRRAALALRRRLHAGSGPLPDVTVALADALGPDGPVVVAHRERRQRLADDEASLRAEHERRRRAERAAFVAATATPTFRTALAAGAPGLWRRFADDDPSPDRAPTARAARRERAVLGHLLRAVGRPVPSGRWAGLAPIEPADERDDPIETQMEDTDPPWRGVCVPHSEDGTGDLHPPSPAVVTVHDAADVVVPDLVPWLALAGDDAPPPPSATTPWHVVDALVSRPPPGPERTAWEVAATTTRAAAQRVESALADLDAAEVAEALGAADAALATLAGTVGRTVPTGPSLRVDHRLPVSVRWTGRDRQRHARAIGALDRLAAVDQGPELWRRASVARLGLAAGQEAPVADVAGLVAGERAPTDHRRPDTTTVGTTGGVDPVTATAAGAAQGPSAVGGTSTISPVTGTTTEGGPDVAAGTERDGGDPATDRLRAPDRVRAFDRFGDDVSTLAGALATRWERLLEARHDEPEVDLGLAELVGVAGDLAERAPVGLGPAGAVLVEPAGAAWRYLGLRPTPAAYAAAHPTVAGPVVAQAQAMVDRWSSADGVPFVEVAPTDAVNPTAAVTPPCTTIRTSRDDLVDAHVGWTVYVDRWHRAWLVDDAGRMHVPVVPHLSAVGTTDPVTAVVATCAGSFGGEVPAGVFPLLPAERERWRHLPRLTVDGDVVVARERVVVDAAELADVGGRADAFDRFVAWVDLVRRHRLPATVTARTGGSPNEPGLLVPTDSALAIDVFLHEHAADGGPPQVVMEHGPDREDALRFPDGTHHVAQLALSWRERHTWERRPPPWHIQGPDAGTGLGGGRRSWCQVDLRYTSTDAGPVIDWPGLRDLVEAWTGAGRARDLSPAPDEPTPSRPRRGPGGAGRWFFVRKPPGLRLRLQVDDPSAFWTAVWAWRRSLPDDTLLEAEPARYRPELERFGGADGMAQAHHLWAATAPVAIALELADRARDARYAVAAVAAQALVDAVLDPTDHAMFWAAQREALAGTEAEPSPGVATALGNPDVWYAALAPPVAAVVDDLGAVQERHRSALRRQCRELPTDVPPAHWLADVVRFQWNAFGLGLDEGAMAAMIAAASA